MRKLLVVLAVAVLPACSTVNLSASLNCSNWLGQTIPPQSRTQQNCPTGNPYVTAATGSANADNNSLIPSGTYYTPNGSYQVSRSGSQTFISRASKR